MRHLCSWLSLLAVLVVGCRDLVVPEPLSGALSGAVKARGAPAPGATVVLSPEVGEPRTLTTDEAGRFEQAGLAPGLWSLNITLPGFLPLDRTVSVNEGTTKDLGTLVLFAETVDLETAGQVVGTVRVSGANPVDVLGATVEAFLPADEARVLAMQAVGATGTFLLSLPPGDYKLRVSHPYFVTAVTANAVTVRSKQEQRIPDDALVMALAPGSLSGRVTKEVDGSPVRTPAANVVVSSDNGSTTTTAMDGTFTLGGLAGGRRSIRFSQVGLQEERPNAAFVITPGEVAMSGDVGMLLERGDVEGTVEMGDGSAVRDVTVSIDGSAYAAPAVATAGDPSRGTFRIARVPVGTYTLTAVRAGYRGATSGAFTISPNTTVVAPALGRLTRVVGDFIIDDSDATNVSGFARERDVVLVVTNPTGVASWRAAQGDPTALPFQPFGADGGVGIAFLLSAGDGEKTIFLQLRDALGNVGPVLSASVVLDTTPPPAPALTLVGGATHTPVTNPLPFSLVGTDAASPGVTPSGVSFMRLSASASVDAAGNLGGPRASYRRDDVFTRTTSGDGPVTVHAQLIDAAGNAGAVASATVVVDTQAPSGTLSVTQGAAATEAGFTNSPLVTLAVSALAEPNGGQVRVRLANASTEVDAAAPQAASGQLGWFLDPQGDGLKTVSFRFVDSAGNQSPVQTATIALDRLAPAPLAPSMVLAALNGPGVVNSRSGAFTATVRDERALSPTAAIELTIAGSVSSLPPTSATTVTGVVPFVLPDADGSHAVSVRFRDAAGNTSPATEARLVLDRAAPAGAMSVEGRLADGAPSSTHTADPVVGVRFTQFGAVSALVTTGALTACPPVDGSWLSLASPALGSFNLGVASGPVTVRACLADEAGNTVLLAPVTLTVDTQAPSGCALQLAGTLRGGGAAPAGLTASPAVTPSLTNCAETPLEISVTEGTVSCTPGAALSWGPLSSLSSLTLSGSDGPKTVRGCVRDAARNVGALVPATIDLDTTPPSAAVITLNGGAPFIGAAQVVAGQHTASIGASASGATEWAVGTSPAPTNFAAFPGVLPRSVALPVPGSGVVTVFARFRDALRNELVVSASVQADLAPPAQPTLSVVPTRDPGYVNSEVVTLQLGASTDATAVRFAEAATAGACATQLATASWQPPLPVSTFVLAPTEVTHVVCAMTRDAADNPSPVASSSVVLDKTPPTRPVIVTPDGFRQLADGATALVDIAAPSTDTCLDGYQRLGGKALTWLDVTPTGLQFGLPVVNDGSESGVRNELRLRAVDCAGNVSGESSVLITADTNAPPAVTVDARWVDNSDGVATAYWQPPAGITDLDHFLVAYDSAPVLPLRGTFAAEGASPLRVPATGASTASASLSALRNATTTYVQITPVDRAGNAGPPNATLLMLQPNEISPNVVASIDLPTLTHAWAMEHHDGFLYVAGSSHPPTTCGLLGDARLLTYDVRRLVPGVSVGAINPAAPPPLTDTKAFVGTFTCTNPGTSAQMDLVVQPPWLFWSVGESIRIYDVSQPGTPQLKATLTLPSGARTTQLELAAADLLMVTTTFSAAPTRTIAIDVSSLYDNNAATVPAYPANDAGTLAAGPFLQGSFFVSRDVALSFDINSNLALIRLGDLFDRSAATSWDTGDVAFNAFYPFQPVNFPVVSGNFAYSATATGQLALFPLNQAWAGSAPTLPLSTTRLFPGSVRTQRFDVQGAEVFLADPGVRGVRIEDFGDLTAPARRTSLDLNQPNVAQALVFSNYMAVLSSPPQTTGTANLTLLEVSTPRGLSVEYALDSASPGRPEVRPGFIIGAGRPTIYDLHGGVGIDGGQVNAGPQLVGEQSSFSNCPSGFAMFDDLEVQANETRLRVMNLEPLLDRDPFVTFGTGECVSGNDVCYPHPTAGVLIFDVAAWGNYLVVAELRASRREVWLEVFDARPLRDRAATTTFSLGSPLASLLVKDLGVGSGSRGVVLDLAHGVAALAVYDDPFALSAGGRVLGVDLRAVFDDNALTVLGATSVQADFAMPQVSGNNVAPRVARLRGTTLYVAATRGVWAIPASGLVDGVSTTVVDGAGAVGFMTDHAFDDLAVAGSSLVAGPSVYLGQGQAVVAFDLSSGPTALRPMGYSAFPPPVTGSISTCTGPTQSRRTRGGVTVQGSRAYVRHPDLAGKLRIMSLE